MQKSTPIQTLERLQATKEQLALTVKKQEQVLKMQLACIPGETIATALYYLLPERTVGKLGNKAINGIRTGLNKALMNAMAPAKKALTLTGEDIKKKESIFWKAYRAYKLFRKYKLV